MEARKDNLCECGCGKTPNISKRDRPEKGIRVGDRPRFCPGHYNRKTAKKSSRVYPRNGWTLKGGYQYIKSRNGGLAIHRLIVERILGKPLPENAAIHHIDEDPSNNAPSNFVVCENNVYHLLLHQRKRALLACGHAGWRKCVYCKSYDDPMRLFIGGPGKAPYHRACRLKYRKERNKNDKRTNSTTESITTAHDTPRGNTVRRDAEQV